MTTFYGYIAPGELASQHDPVRVLRTALAKSDLVDNPSYDPNRVSFWAKEDIVGVDQPPAQILNQQTGEREAACVCTLETQ